MITVGFIVEGKSEKILVESHSFRGWLGRCCNLELVFPVGNAGGGGNLRSRNIAHYVKILRKVATPDKVVVLADLDPDNHISCITARKAIIGCQGIDLVVIARKAIEAWFLADTKAMRAWCGDQNFFVCKPEATRGAPWDEIITIRTTSGRGAGTKVTFAKNLIRRYKFDIERAATHPQCPSAHYCVTKLRHLAK